MAEDHPTFSSAAEEAQYWKKQAAEHQRAAKVGCNIFLTSPSNMLSCQEATKELEEFQEGSRELEAELEAQLEQAESKTKELKSLANKYV